MTRKILFYISGHGFGHATRVCAILSELRKRFSEWTLYIRTNAPSWIFEKTLSTSENYTNIPIDTGTHQHDFIHLDKKQSLINYSKLIEYRKKIIPEEISFIKQEGIDIIVGDIPPVAFYIAHKAGIKSIAISNFSWDWIFSPYIKAFPEYRFVIDDIKKGYSYADLLLRLPFAGDFSAFSKITDIPLLVRKHRIDSNQMRSKLGLINESRPLILCSFGGFNILNFDFIAMTAKNPDYFFIGFNNSVIQKGSNYIILPNKNEFDHPSLVNMSDIIVAKLGYGTVSECIATNTPILYLARSDFLECPILENAVKRYLVSRRIEKECFFNGVWHNDLNKLLWNTSIPLQKFPYSCDGATRAVDILYSF